MTSIRDTPATSQNRLGWVDGLRGLAIVLMVLDHALVQAEPDSFLRWTVTRFSLPFFMIAAAMVWRPMSCRRLASLGVAAAAELVLLGALGMAQPGIVAVFVLAMLAVELLRWVSPGLVDAPGVVLMLGLLWALYQPWSNWTAAPGEFTWWTGYEPGLVLAWWALGRLAAVELVPVFVRSPRWLRAIGRRPLVWYVGHLVAIYAVVATV